MDTVNMHEAKTHLSKLLKRAAAGEEIIISNGGKPIARLVGVEPAAPRVLDMDHGHFTVPEDFDDPMPDEFYDMFEQ